MSPPVQGLRVYPCQCSWTEKGSRFQEYLQTSRILEEESGLLLISGMKALSQSQVPSKQRPLVKIA